MLCRSCKNPQNFARDIYCSKCGEKLKAQRIGVFGLLEALSDDFFGFEKGFIYTLYALVKNPAAVVKSYLNGARKKFHSPAKLYAVVLFFSLFVFSNTSTFQVNFGDGVEKGFDHSRTLKKKPQKAQIVDKDSKEKILLREIAQHFEKNHKTYLQIFFLTWIPIAAFFLWLFFGYRKFSFGETLIVSGYLSALSLFIATLNEMVSWLFPQRIDNGYYIFEIFSFIFYYYLIRQIYFRKAKKFDLRFVSFQIATLCVYLVLISLVILLGLKPYLMNISQ